MKLLYCLSIGFIFFALQACKPKEPYCYSLESAYIDSTVVPNSGIVNEPVNLSVYYGIHNGCGELNSAKLVQNQNTFRYDIKVKYEGCQCTMIAFWQKSDFTFTPNQPGTYVFKYDRGADTLIVK